METAKRPSSKNKGLPRLVRAAHPPRMALTARDVQVVEAVYHFRVLRRDQVQALLFPSVRTAQRALSRLFQHGFLARQFLPTAYGEGQSQALYLLDERGADLMAAELGVDRGAVLWTRRNNQVSTPFLDHTLAVNDVRIAIGLAVQRQGWQIERYLDESQLKSQEARDYVQVSTSEQGRERRQRVAVVPDGYFALEFGKRAHFFLEADQATEANKRWATKVKAYLAYWNSGQYQERYQARSLRILTVTTGQKRLANLKETTEEAGGKRIFWFTTFAQVTPERVLTEPIWEMAGSEGVYPLIETV